MDRSSTHPTLPYDDPLDEHPAIVNGTSADPLFPTPPTSKQFRRGKFCQVILTGAFLAEAAAAIDNKLNVSGGVLSRFVVAPDRLTRFVLVVLTQAEMGNSDRRVDVEVRPPTDDEPVHMNFDVPEGAIAEFPGFAFFEIQISLPVDGRWVLVVSGGTGAISLPLLVTEMAPPLSLDN